MNTVSIGIIGAGDMGKVLARRLAKRGHHVSIANSTGPESLTALAAEIGATPGSVVDAAQAGEIVILAIPSGARTHATECARLWSIAHAAERPLSSPAPASIEAPLDRS
jgi:predicted dinucleotide-binding enzyme